jgi:hypothetical protein
MARAQFGPHPIPSHKRRACAKADACPAYPERNLLASTRARHMQTPGKATVP